MTGPFRGCLSGTVRQTHQPLVLIPRCCVFRSSLKWTRMTAECLVFQSSNNGLASNCGITHFRFSHVIFSEGSPNLDCQTELLHFPLLLPARRRAPSMPGSAELNTSRRHPEGPNVTLNYPRPLLSTLFRPISFLPVID